MKYKKLMMIRNNTGLRTTMQYMIYKLLVLSDCLLL